MLRSSSIVRRSQGQRGRGSPCWPPALSAHASTRPATYAAATRCLPCPAAARHAAAAQCHAAADENGALCGQAQGDTRTAPLAADMPAPIATSGSSTVPVEGGSEALASKRLELQPSAPGPAGAAPKPAPRPGHAHHHHEAAAALFEAAKRHYGSLSAMQVLRSGAFRGPMLFLLGGGAMAWLLVAWARGSAMRPVNPYSFSVTFPLALGLEAGVPLRLKGVPIGHVKEVRSGLEAVEAVVEVHQKSTRIPRGSGLLFNKAGAMTPTPFIDVRLPKDPASAPEEREKAALQPAGAAKRAEGGAAEEEEEERGPAAAGEEEEEDEEGGLSAAAGARSGRPVLAQGGRATSDEEPGQPGSSRSASEDGGPGLVKQSGPDQEPASQLSLDGGELASGARLLTGRVPVSAAVAAAVAAVAGPDDIDACRSEGRLICRGDRVAGLQGGGMDEFSALMLRNMVRSAEQWQLPPGLRGRAVEAGGGAAAAAAPPAPAGGPDGGGAAPGGGRGSEAGGGAAAASSSATARGPVGGGGKRSSAFPGGPAMVPAVEQ